MTDRLIENPLVNGFESDGVVKFAVCGCAVAVANLRPTYIGETQSFPVCFMLVALEVLIVLNLNSSKARLSLGRTQASQIILYISVITYLLARAILSTDLGAEFAFKSYMISTSFITIIIIVASIHGLSRIFFDAFAIIIIASCASVVITFSLVAVGVPISTLSIGYLPDPPTYAPGSGQVAFPFTHVTNEASSWIGVAPRLAGLMREVGVFPPFACWAATYAYLRKWSLIIPIICLVASLLCLSTIGPLALYTAATLVLFKLKLKPIPTVVIIAVLGLFAWPVIYTMDYIGLEQKMNSGTGSYEDREWLFWAVLETQNVLIGDGNRWSLVSSSAGINLISQIRVFGLIYFVFVIGIYFLAMSNFRLWLAAGVPALITVFFSQPITIEPAFLMIFFSGAAFAPRATQTLRPKPLIQGALTRRR